MENNENTGEYSMTYIYEHEIPERRMLNFAHVRQNEIDEQIKQLQMERELMQMILDKFDTTVCPACKGAGHIMKPIPGCECDGPRMHKCEKCGGVGK